MELGNINEFRKYRIQSEYPFINNEAKGIALFDLIMSFLLAWLLDYYFKLSDFLPGQNKIQTYYLLIIPLGVFTHLIFAQPTFLNKQIFNNEFNIYKIVFYIIIYYIIQNLSKA
jgi:hypothetical protein